MRKIALVAVTGLLICGATNALATEVWSGLDYTFEKPSWADWTLPENQDRITDNIWITRKDTQGIFNIKQEDSYQDGVSPLDTGWAYGNVEDWESLDFQPWIMWAGHNPSGTVGQDAVLHLISDDIYLDIMFTGWIGGNNGGGFSYLRAVPEPATLSLLGLAGLLFGRRR